MITGDHIVFRTGVGGMTPVLVPGLQSWRASDKVNELNAQDATDEGYEHPEAGSRSVTINGTIVVDILTGDLLVIEAGTVIADAGFYAHKDADDPIYLFDEFLILSCEPQGEMQGRFTCNFSGKGVGPFTFNDPSGITP